MVAALPVDRNHCVTVRAQLAAVLEVVGDWWLVSGLGIRFVFHFFCFWRDSIRGPGGGVASR